MKTKIENGYVLLACEKCGGTRAVEITNISKTSIKAHDEITADGTKRRIREKVLDAVKKIPMPTSRRISDHTGIERASVCGRLNELQADGVIIVSGEVHDETTGKLTQVYAINNFPLLSFPRKTNAMKLKEIKDLIEGDDSELARRIRGIVGG